MKKSVIFAAFSLFCLPLISFGEESRTWTNSAGKTIQAEIVKKDATSVDLKLANGKIATVKITDLNAADQEYIKSWEPKADDAAAGDAAEKVDKFTWQRSDDRAFKLAKEAKLPVVILFTGTSWNEQSKKLDSEVLGKSDFKKGMSGVAIGLVCESEKDGKFKRPWAAELAEKYKSAGAEFPRMVIVDSEGVLLGSIKGFDASKRPKGYVTEIKELLIKK